MGWVLVYDESKGYYDTVINEKTKTFITTDDVGDYSGIVEMLKSVLLSNDDAEITEGNDPNFTLSASVFDYYAKTDPRGSRLEYLLTNKQDANYLDNVKKECERCTQPLLGKEFKNKQVCEAILFTPRQENSNVVLDINIIFKDNDTINTTLILNSLQK